MNKNYEAKAETVAASTITGMISSIDDNTITLSMGGGERPNGEAPDGNGGGEKPGGDMQMPEGEKSQAVTVIDTTVITDEDGNTISLSDLSEGTMVTVSLDEDGNAVSITITTMELSMGGPGQSQGAPTSYSSLNEYTTDTSISNETFLSTGTDENAILVSNAANVSLDSTAIHRISTDSTGGDNSSFYRIGAATLVTDGTLTANNGGMFYTTNTESTFYLSDVDITYADKSDFFLKCTGNSNQRGWGQTGNNGADCTFTANKQEMEGDIIWDSISTLVFHMENGSALTGAFVQDESAAGNGGNGYANLTIDSSSKWVVTGNSTLSSLTCKGTIVDENGNTVTIKNADGKTLVEGTSHAQLEGISYQPCLKIKMQ